MKKSKRLAAWLFLMLCCAPAAHAACEVRAFDDQDYTVCSFDPATDDIRLFRADETGTIFGSFFRLKNHLAERDQTLTFAMNGGMYHPDRSAVGLYIENGGDPEQRLITSDGPGNFGLLPNGVFCFGDGHAAVIESLRFQAEAPTCPNATQSGPMLVIDGDLHPRFLPDSDSRYIRNGVGVDDAGRVWFAISDDPVTFHEFGRLFRDGLNTPNALFLDGNISRIYAPEVGRVDAGFPMGPIIGVVTPR